VKSEDVAKAYAMPLASPAFPKGPYRFYDREFLVIIYRTDERRLRAARYRRAAGPARSATHLVADLTLGLGTVVHDYLAKEALPLPKRAAGVNEVGGRLAH
jgi:acetoacetate decarboxylase